MEGGAGAEDREWEDPLPVWWSEMVVSDHKRLAAERSEAKGGLLKVCLCVCSVWWGGAAGRDLAWGSR